MAMRILKWIGIGFAAFIGLIILFVLVSIAPIQRYEYKEQNFYKSAIQELDSLKPLPIPVRDSGFSIGYAVVNITPDHQTALAGYGNRRGKLFSSVRDSIYVRALVIENGTQRAAI